ncbi:hypothetical protein D3C81_1874120 [compost metagenome]
MLVMQPLAPGGEGARHLRVVIRGMAHFGTPVRGAAMGPHMLARHVVDNCLTGTWPAGFL